MARHKTILLIAVAMVAGGLTLVGAITGTGVLIGERGERLAHVETRLAEMIKDQREMLGEYVKSCAQR